MNEDVLLEDGLWKIIKMAQDSEYCDIWHNCDVKGGGFIYVALGHKKCFNCDEPVPEKIETVATLFGRSPLNPKYGGDSNVFFGYNAGMNVHSGHHNIAIGNLAGITGPE